MRRDFPLLSTVTAAVLFTGLCGAASADSFRAFSRYPAGGNPATLIAGRDGYFYGVDIETIPGGRGCVYRVAPDGEYKLLHRFPFLRTFPAPNEEGSTPLQTFTMGKDGCLYGLTRTGGRFSRGVLYRVMPDGQFSVVVDLDPIRVLGSSPESANFSDLAQCLIEGSDHAFYTSAGRGEIVRLGLDGSMSLVANPGLRDRTFQDPSLPGVMVVVATGGEFEKRARFQKIRITDGAILAQATCPLFGSPVTSVSALAFTEKGLLLGAGWMDGSAGGTRLYWMKGDGALEFIDDFKWTGEPGDPPYLNVSNLVRAEADGTIYYTAGNARKGLAGGGDTLIEYKPGGSYRVVCGFGDYAPFGIVRNSKDSLYGATLGNTVYAPRDENMLYSQDWMKGTPGQARVVAKLGKGGTFFQIHSGETITGSALPIADIDLVKSKGDRSLLISPLRNDRNPDNNRFELSLAGPASRGIVSMALSPGQKNQVTYIPAGGGRLSATIPYDITDGNGHVATGTIFYRGDSSGTYESEEPVIEGRPLVIRVQSNGSYKAVIPWGTERDVKISGMLDWNDSSFEGVDLSADESASLKISLVAEEGLLAPAFQYTIGSSFGTVQSGRAIFKR